MNAPWKSALKRNAARKDVPTVLEERKECALGMVQRIIIKNAVLTGAPTLPSKEVSVKSMGRWLLLERNAIVKAVPTLQ